MQIANFINSCGTLSLINFAKKHHEALSNLDIETFVGLAPRVEDTIATLETAFGVRRPLKAAWVAATAAKDAADDALDTEIGDTSYELLGPKQLNGDRRHPDYRALFPNGNIQFIHGPDREEVVQIKAMVAYLEQHPEHPLAGRAEALKTKVQALEDALSPMTEAKSALRDAEDKERVARDALAPVLRKNAAILRAEYMDEDKVAAFFPPVPVQGNDDEAADGDSPS